VEWLVPAFPNRAGSGYAFQIITFPAEIRFGLQNQIIAPGYIFVAIECKKSQWFTGWIIFKCLAVLYVDPQNLMTNRRNLPLVGKVSVSREKQRREQGINTSVPYIVSP
jgi:hypothetical protein